MLTTITDLLTALLQLLKQKHLLSKDYQEHLLYERLQKGIDEDIDRVKEIALACGYSEDIADAKNSLINGANILKDIDDIEGLEQTIIIEIDKTIKKLNTKEINEKNTYLDEVFNQYVAKEGLINALGDISEKRIRDIYLLRFDKEKK